MKLVHGQSADAALAKAGGAYSESTAGVLPGILESSDDLFAAVDPDIRLLAFNAAFRRGFSDRSGTVPQLNQTLEQVFAIVSADAASMVGLCRRAFSGEGLRLPLELERAGEHPRFFDVSVNPVKDPNGTTVIVAIVMRDVTDKRITEQKFRGVLESTPDAMLLAHGGIIEFANSQLETMFGYAPGAMTGVPLESLIPERLRERHLLQRAGFESAPRTRPMGTGLDLYGLKADGSEFPVEISLSPLQINGDRLIIAAVRDVSARRRTEDALRAECIDLRRQLATLQRRQDVPSNLEVFRAGFEKATVAMAHYGPDGRFKRVNSRFCALLGYRREELLQLTIQKITHRDDIEVNTELDIKLLAGAIAEYEIDKRLLRKDGSELWARVGASIQRNEGGAPDYVIVVAYDATERKQAEDALRETQQRLAMTAEIAQVGYAELDLETRKAFFSPELKRQLGYANHELSNDFGEWTRRLHPDDSEHVATAMETLIAEPKRPLVLEFRLRHEDGNYRWFLQRGTAVQDLPGQARKLLFTQIDITDRKAAEKVLREQTEELRLAMRVGQSGTFQWNADTHEHRWSDEILHLYGLERHEFAGTDEAWLSCLLPDDRASAMAAVDASLKSGDYAAEFRIRRRRDGTIRWISARGQVFFDAEGIPKRMLGINTDVTEHHHLLDELEASQTRLVAILDSLTEGVIIFDLHGQILDTNPATLRMLGFDNAEDMRRRVSEFTDTFEVSALDGRAIPLEEWPISRVMRGESFTDYEMVVRRKDDGRSMITSHNGSPVRTGHGQASLGVLTLIDVTSRKRAESALKESERRLALALESADSVVWELAVAGRKVFSADERLFTMLGYATVEIMGSDAWIALVHDDERQGAIDAIEEIIAGRRETNRLELRMRGKDGRWHWIMSQCVAAERDVQGRALRLVGTNTDISERKQVEERVRDASLHDPLTGLPNRAFIMEYGGHMLAAAQRNHGRGALLFIDLDRFKPINDQYGHEVGDRVLQEVARRLLSCTRHEDLVGRLGGDEFVIVLPHLDAGRHRAATVAKHVVDRLAEPIFIDKRELSIGASVGIGYYLEHGADMSALIHAADLAMYQAKQAGRGNYHFYSPDLERPAEEAQSIEARIKNALKSGGFALHYQPVVDVKSGKLTGAEALLRFTDDSGDTSGPGSFIPVAEAAGLIGELGDWVAMEACRQHEAWLREGLRISIAINVSPLQFRQQAFAEKLAAIISDSGIDPACLQLEVSESAVMESLDDAVEIMSRIKSLGVKVALDDVGTGYSNLSRLSRLPLDTLKVDQSFLRRIGSDPASRAVTEAIIGLGRSLKLEVIGEGIESEDALRYLQEQGCNQAQGFWFSQPLPASEFSQWYHRQQMH